MTDEVIPTCAVCGKQPQTTTRHVIGGGPNETIRCCPHHDGYFYITTTPGHGDRLPSQMVQWRARPRWSSGGLSE